LHPSPGSSSRRIRPKGGEEYGTPEIAPRDHQREAASLRERAVAASGGASEVTPLDEEEIPFLKWIREDQPNHAPKLIR
jgi:hypothetical protein